MTSETLQHAENIWNYLASFSGEKESDAIVVCCSYDLRVCDYACELLKQSLAPKLLFTGKTGNWTRHLWEIPEAQVFRERALTNGINESSIFTEETAGNIGENIARSKELIPDAGTVTFITKPNTILRVKLTIPLQWPEITAYTACPQFEFPKDVSNVIGVFGVINEMVGDIQRIMLYPEQGFQIEHQLPDEVVASWEYLVGRGFTAHMM